MNADIIILGGGPGGYNAAAAAAAKGLQVVLIESDHVGGTCLNRGCIPTKCFCRSAQVAADVADAAQFGVMVADAAPAIDMPRVVERKDAVVGQLRSNIEMLLQNVTTVHARGRFTGPHTVEADGEEYSAPRIIIATGSSSAVLPIPGASLAVSSTEMLELDYVPETLAIIGGGVIGMEFASIFAAFGTRVSVVEYCKEILPPFDADIAKRLRMQMKARGVEFYTGSQVTAITGEPGALSVQFEAKGKPAAVEAQVVLMAVGRRPVVPDGAEAAGIEVGRRGIVVDPATFETSVEGVYAIGDCNGVCMLAHAAEAQAARVMGEEINLDVIPSAVFTMPECAMVGLTQEQCKAQEINYKATKALFRSNGKALAMGEDGGIIKVLADADTGRLLGCHICGPHAADLITEPALAIANGMTVAQLLRTVHAHPTLSEALLPAYRL